MGILKNRKQGLLQEGSHQRGINYDETFALIFKYTSIHTIIELLACVGWFLYHMDVNTTLLNGVIEEVYIN